MRYVLFGVLVGFSATIKPQAILFLPASLIATWYADFSGAKKNLQQLYLAVFYPILGTLVPFLVALLWLAKQGALGAFWEITVLCLIPLHAKLGAQGFFYLLGRCLTASHATLLALSVVLAITRGEKKQSSDKDERLRPIVVYGMAFGLISYMGQMRGYAYHRYPFVAFLFLFAALAFTDALNDSGIRQFIAIVGVCFGLILGILYARSSLHDTWRPFQVNALVGDLRSLNDANLSRNIQCIDTIDGCSAALERLHVVQSTGMIYDEFLFLQPGIATSREEATIDKMKSRFLRRISSDPPRIIVITPWLFPDGPGNYEKLKRWSALSNLISNCYELKIQRNISAGRLDHPGYRIYVRTPFCK